MVKGIAFALSACFIWGLIFVVPELMSGFSSIEVVLGRHFCYGILSVLIFAKSRFINCCNYPLHVWKKALLLALIMNIILYTFLVLSLRYATPAVTALILGLSPITISFWCNFKQKEISYTSLVLPSLAILLGLIMVNLPHLQSVASDSITSYAFGLFSAVVALLAWTWYIVTNARFLKDNPTVLPKEWSTVLGVATLFWVIVLASILGLIFADSALLNKYLVYSEQLQSYIIGSLILGFLCSWVAAALWNNASFYLPVTMTGQLTIFETIFGVLFVYIFEQKIPLPLECAGIITMLVAIIWGIRVVAKQLPDYEMAH